MDLRRALLKHLLDSHKIDKTVKNPRGHKSLLPRIGLNYVELRIMTNGEIIPHILGSVEALVIFLSGWTNEATPNVSMIVWFSQKARSTYKP